MKKQLFALVGVCLLLGTVSAYAQTVRVNANVPFHFIVNSEVLPAGQYTIQSEGWGQSLLIRSADMQSKTFAIPNRCESARPANQTKLVFHKYGDRYFLAQIWMEGSVSGREFATSQREAEVASNVTMQQVVLTASLQ